MGIVCDGVSLVLIVSTLSPKLQEQRRRLKAFIEEEIDGICEVCNGASGLPGIDLHEVYVRRSALPVKLQGRIFVRGNCALVCVACHRADMGQRPPAETEAFKERFKKRLIKLGHTPLDPATVVRQPYLCRKGVVL